MNAYDAGIEVNHESRQPMSKQVPIGGTDASADLGQNAAVATTAVAVGAAISQIIMNGALA